MIESSSRPTDLAILHQRIDTLERRNRATELRYAAGACLALLVAFLACASQGEGSLVQSARAFQLLDAAGEVRGEWRITDEGDPSFALLDDEQRKRFEVLLKRNEAVHLRMRDRDDQVRISQIVDGASHPHILLTDATQKLRVQMAIAGSGAPSMVFFDAEGESTAGVGIHADGRAWLRPAVPDEPR